MNNNNRIQLKLLNTKNSISVQCNTNELDDEQNYSTYSGDFLNEKEENNKQLLNSVLKKSSQPSQISVTHEPTKSSDWTPINDY